MKYSTKYLRAVYQDVIDEYCAGKEVHEFDITIKLQKIIRVSNYAETKQHIDTMTELGLIKEADEYQSLMKVIV